MSDHNEAELRELVVQLQESLRIALERAERAEKKFEQTQAIRRLIAKITATRDDLVVVREGILMAIDMAPEDLRRTPAFVELLFGAAAAAAMLNEQSVDQATFLLGRAWRAVEQRLADVGAASTWKGRSS